MHDCRLGYMLNNYSSSLVASELYLKSTLRCLPNLPPSPMYFTTLWCLISHLSSHRLFLHGCHPVNPFCYQRYARLWSKFFTDSSCLFPPLFMFKLNQLNRLQVWWNDTISVANWFYVSIATTSFYQGHANPNKPSITSNCWSYPFTL